MNSLSVGGGRTNVIWREKGENGRTLVRGEWGNQGRGGGGQ